MVVAEGRTERDVACGPGGLQAGAGLRGPYGTSVRHTWPTWILLISTVTLISTATIFFSLSFPPFAPIFSKEAFLSHSAYKYTHMFCLLFTLCINIWCSRFSFSQISIVIHSEISRFPLYPSHICYLPSRMYSQYFNFIHDVVSIQHTRSFTYVSVCTQ